MANKIGLKGFTLVNFALLFFVVRTVSGQPRPETIFIGGESLSLGMAQQEATRRLEKCCSISVVNDPRDPNVKSSFISNKDRTDILGSIWFRDGKVKRLQREGEFSQNPESIRLVLALYRLLSQATHSEPVTVVLHAGTQELSNGSSKTITLTFSEGRSVQIDIASPDNTSEMPNSVGLREILER